MANSILIVDDEQKILETTRDYLRSKGYCVYCAANGGEALEIWRRESVSLILLDLMLPDMRGEEVCRTVRQKSRVPIIMLTAKVDEEDMLNGLGIGADDYITKPFSLKALHARIEAVLRRSRDDVVPLYNKSSWGGGDLEITFDTRTVKKKGEDVALTPNEFKILSALMKYPGRILTRDELISLALGDKFDGYDRAVDTHVKNLRHKIEDNPRSPVYILTVYGVGYRFGGDRFEKI
ncbi:MAG: response regulator transcription factor [Defluviitaleaceae bacterium]|nr:response regulator transcription factor [Defluviitaleaceae bacterium]